MNIQLPIEHEQIKEYLQQRYPFLLVDRILEISGKSIIGKKNITGTDPYLAGHFPDNPVLPGVILLEAISQCGGILCFFSDVRKKKIKKGYIVKIDNVRFLKPVIPGDTVVLKAELLQKIKNYAKVAGTAEVEEKVVAKAEITYYIEV